MKNSIHEIDEIAVVDTVFTQKFECDLEKCKGACCTLESDYGAPIDEEEIPLITKNLKHIKKYMNPAYIPILDKEGFTYSIKNSLMVRSINNRDCIFALYENGIAFCAIERAYLNKEIKYKKPISCHLFPIRIANFGGPVLHFEEYDECAPAKEKGNKTGTTVFEFCKDALERKFGKKWYGKVMKYIRGKNA